MSQEPLVPVELKDIEAALAGLSPRAARLDRDRLMFLAGRVSIEGTSVEGAAGAGGATVRTDPGPPAIAPAVPDPGWIWKAATCVSAALSVVLAVLLFLRGDRPVEIRFVERPQRDVVAVTDQHIKVDNTPLAAAGPTAPAAESTGPSQPVGPRWAAPGSYLYIRDVALRYGIDAVQFPSRGGPAANVTYGELMEQLAPELLPAAGLGRRGLVPPLKGNGGVQYDTGAPS